jgi:DNA-binding MarR family transcriptional regulator
VEAGLVSREPAADDRRRVELSLTPRGRRLERRVSAARDGVMELGRQAMAGRDFEPLLQLLRELLAATPYAALIARRRELMERTRTSDSGH